MDSILDQGVIWRDKDGVEHMIVEMDPRYALNVYEWMKRTHKGLAYRYSIELSTTRMPDEDTIAYDMALDAVTRELELIREKPLHWLLDKPLMRALAARVMSGRIEKGTYDRIAVEVVPSPLPDAYQASEFRPKPPVEIDLSAYGQRPGDETKVFLVYVGEHDERGVQAVFVGNRAAAFQYAAEYDRYRQANDVDVEEWDDHPEGGPGVYGQIRRYPTPWTQVEYLTAIDMTTGEVVRDSYPYTRVERSDPKIQTESTPEGPRGRYRAQIVTNGPDTRHEEVRTQHAEAVNNVRAAVMEDMGGARP